MHDLRILDAAEDDFTRLEQAIAQRIISRIQWLAEHFDEIKPELLTGTYRDFSNCVRETTA